MSVRRFVAEYRPPPPEPVNVGLLAALPNVPLRSRYLVTSFLAGRHRSVLKGQSVEFTEYRSYQQGDDLRRVDWRYFARSDRLTVRVYEQDTQLRVYLVLDTSASMAYRSRPELLTKLDFAKTILGATALLARRQQDACGLALIHEDIAGFLRHSSSPSQTQTILSALDGCPSGPPLALGVTVEKLARLLPSRSLIVLASDFYDGAEGLRPVLQRLRYDGHDVIGLQVMDPIEVDFATEEEGVFYDVETGFGLEVSPDEARAAYLQNFRKFREEVAGVFHDAGSDCPLLRTDQMPTLALATYLAGREKQR